MGNSRLYATLNWHSFGGSHESFVCAAVLAQQAKRDLLLLKPRLHIMRGYYHQAVFGDEMSNLYINGEPLRRGDFSQRMLELYLTMNRGIHLFTMIPGLLRKLRIDPEKLFPRYLGYSWTQYTWRELEDLYQVDLHAEKIYESIEFDLSPDQYIRAEQEIKKVNLDWDRPLAIVYVRDGNFGKTRNQKEGSDVWNYKVEDIKEVIAYLVDRGFSVVRMGDSSMVPLDLQLEHFWDYSKSGMTSSLLDLYIHRKAEFWFGSPGGARPLTDLWRTPSVMFNGIGYGYMMMWNDSDVFLSTKVYDREKKIFLDPMTILELQSVNQRFFEEKPFQIVPNPSSEILKACRQFFGEEPFDEELQKKFWERWNYFEISPDSRNHLVSRYLMRTSKPYISY